MMTLISTLLGFASGGLPKLLEFAQQKGDQKHELALMAAQRERELALAKEGFVAQARVEEIITDQVAMQTQAQERVAMYKHDSKLADNASTWVINLRASVRPVVTYLFVGMLCTVNGVGIWYAYSTGVPFNEAIDLIWSESETSILATIIAFWFGSQAFNSKR
jgi:hypothetical protein